MSLSGWVVGLRAAHTLDRRADYRLGDSSSAAIVPFLAVMFALTALSGTSEACAGDGARACAVPVLERFGGLVATLACGTTAAFLADGPFGGREAISPAR